MAYNDSIVSWGGGNMEINTTVVYTDKILKDFIQFKMFRGKYYKAIRVLFRALGPLLILVGIYFFIIKPYIAIIKQIIAPETIPLNPSNLPSTYIFLFGLFITVYVYLTPGQTLRRSQKTFGTINRYVFYEAEFHTEMQSVQATSSSQIKYCALQSVYETNEYIYLFINAGTGFIVEKRDLPSGTVPELRSVLSKQVKKYVVCKGTRDLNIT